MLKRFWNAPLTWGSVITAYVATSIVSIGAMVVWLGYPKKWYVSVKDKIMEKFKK
jgi:hypothetical protein